MSEGLFWIQVSGQVRPNAYLSWLFMKVAVTKPMLHANPTDCTREKGRFVSAENPHQTKGHRDYCVDLTPGKERCNCEAFAKYGDCKHHLAVELMRDEDAEWDRQAAEWEACRY